MSDYNERKRCKSSNYFYKNKELYKWQRKQEKSDKLDKRARKLSTSLRTI